MAFEVAGVMMVEAALEYGAEEMIMSELMPMAFESFGSEFLGSEFLGGEALSSLFGAEGATPVLQAAATPAAESAALGGAGAGEGITAATPGALETGAATPEAVSPFSQTAPSGMGMTPAEPLAVPEPAGQFSQAELDAINQGQIDAANSGPSPYEPTASTGETPLVEKAPQGVENAGRGFNIGSQPTPSASYNGYTPGDIVNAGNPNYPSTMGNLNPNITSPVNTAMQSSSTGLGNMAGTPQPESGFLQGLKDVGGWMSDNPIKTGIGAYALANYTGMLNPSRQGVRAQEEKTPFNNPYHFSSNFQGSHPTPQVYKPDYTGYAKPAGYAAGGMAFDTQDDQLGQGGITNVPRYYRGELATSYGQRGDTYGATRRFLDMYDPSSRYEAPSDAAPNLGVGTFHDTNPSTRNKSAADAAETRRKAIESRSYVKSGANYVPPSRKMGQLKFNAPGVKDDNDSDSDSTLNAASGGIMGANLGSYAAGGNPRLLRGPGDGMSDNIPATIGGRQPARLADGEFVVPADVVSHLGNGSTEAGAKRLHEMMNKVRVDRTGKKKQAPAVKAGKYIPK